MRKFIIPTHRFPTIVPPFSSSFVQVRTGVPECVNAVPATSDRRAGDGGQSFSNRGYAAAAIRPSHIYWQSNDR